MQLGPLASLVVAIFVVAVVSATSLQANQDLQEQQQQDQQQDVDFKKDRDDELNSCQYNYLRLPANFVQLSIYHLQLKPQHDNLLAGSHLTLVAGRPNKTSQVREQVDLHPRVVVPTFKRLDLDASSDELRTAGLEPEKPFKFFMSGFNPNRESAKPFKFQLDIV